MTGSPDDRSAIAQAWVWSFRVTTVALEMAIPAAGGYWLDQRLGTRLVFVVLGVILGMTVGLTSLLRMTATPPKRDTPTAGERPEHRKDHAS